MKLKKSLNPTEFAAWAKSLNISSFSIIMVSLLVFGLLILSPGITTLIEQRRKIAELEQSVRESTAAVDEIEAERDRWRDPAFIRSQARDRLFFVMPGEIQLSVIDDVEIVETPQRATSASLTARERDWMRSLTQSFLTAGTTDAVPEVSDEATP